MSDFLIRTSVATITRDPKGPLRISMLSGEVKRAGMVGTGLEEREWFASTYLVSYGLSLFSGGPKRSLEEENTACFRSRQKNALYELLQPMHA
jgi:hypothetical protein